MNYFVFSKRKDQSPDEDTTWSLSEHFSSLSEAETYLEDNADNSELEYRLVPAQTEEDAKAELDMPYRLF